MFSACTPIALTKLVQNLPNFTFISETMDDIKAGIQPFVIAYASAEYNRQTSLEIAHIYMACYKPASNQCYSQIFGHYKLKLCSQLP
jgi:hypothetical protein